MSDPTDILEVLADFYKDIYASQHATRTFTHDLTDAYRVAAVTVKELTTELLVMKRGKAADRNGIVAEMLQKASATLLAYVAELFTHTLQQDGEMPTS